MGPKRSDYRTPCSEHAWASTSADLGILRRFFDRSYGFSRSFWPLGVAKVEIKKEDVGQRPAKPGPDSTGRGSLVMKGSRFDSGRLHGTSGIRRRRSGAACGEGLGKTASLKSPPERFWAVAGSLLRRAPTPRKCLEIGRFGPKTEGEGFEPS